MAWIQDSVHDGLTIIRIDQLVTHCARNLARFRKLWARSVEHTSIHNSARDSEYEE